MFDVVMTDEALAQIGGLPLVIQGRIQTIVERLRDWPDVSGVKALRGELRGSYRVRTGGYRILFIVDEARNRVTIFRVADRRDVYE